MLAESMVRWECFVPVDNQSEGCVREIFEKFTSVSKMQIIFVTTKLLFGIWLQQMCHGNFVNMEPYVDTEIVQYRHRCRMCVADDKAYMSTPASQV